MIEETVFASVKKIDAHNHLNLGMNMADYSAWAGFFIPNFPRIISGLTEMHQIIAEYTRPRCVTRQDVQALLRMSLEAAYADGVEVLEGSVDIGFINHFDGDIDAFLQMVDTLAKNYASHITFKPELGMGKTFDIDKIKQWAPVCIESGVFSSIDLYGPEIEEGLENFVPLFNLAGKHKVKKKAHVGEFSDAASVRHFVEKFDLDEVQHGINAAKDDSVLKFLKDKDVRLNVCPASNVLLTAVPSLKEHPIRKLIEAGLRITIGTDDLLFFNRTVGKQCADLVNAGLITENEALKMMSQR